MTTSDVDRARLLIADNFRSATTQLIPVSGRTTGGYFLRVTYLNHRHIFERFEDVAEWITDQLMRSDLSQGMRL